MILNRMNDDNGYVECGKCGKLRSNNPNDLCECET